MDHDDPPKRIGRPPLDADDSSTSVCVTLPTRTYDRLYAQAQRDRTTIPEVIRRRLKVTQESDVE